MQNFDPSSVATHRTPAAVCWEHTRRLLCIDERWVIGCGSSLELLYDWVIGRCCMPGGHDQECLTFAGRGPAHIWTAASSQALPLIPPSCVIEISLFNTPTAHNSDAHIYMRVILKTCVLCYLVELFAHALISF